MPELTHNPRSSSSRKINQNNETFKILDPLTRLKYTDLVYLLNILKLQAAKKSDSLAQTRDEWIADLELALSIVQSTSGNITNEKNTKTALAR